SKSKEEELAMQILVVIVVVEVKVVDQNKYWEKVKMNHYYQVMYVVKNKKVILQLLLNGNNIEQKKANVKIVYEMKYKIALKQWKEHPSLSTVHKQIQFWEGKKAAIVELQSPDVEDAQKEVDLHYGILSAFPLQNVIVQDLTKAITEIFKYLKRYKIEEVEEQLHSMIRSKMEQASDPREMFRDKIRNAIWDFQQELITNIEREVKDLQERYPNSLSQFNTDKGIYGTHISLKVNFTLFKEMKILIAQRAIQNNRIDLKRIYP
ncbi:hypothetical protein RFI_21596, partial [Reticulomyxa filosa]